MSKEVRFYGGWEREEGGGGTWRGLEVIVLL